MSLVADAPTAMDTATMPLNNNPSVTMDADCTDAQSAATDKVLAVGESALVSKADRVMSQLSNSADLVDLSHCKLLHVPNDVFQFRSVQLLYLESNRLESLPDELFTSLPDLEYLDVRYNQLMALPESIGRHRKLRTLLL